MRSFWIVCYVGSHTSTTIKKLERILGIKATDIERERIVFDGLNLERATFYVTHKEPEWNDTVLQLMYATAKIALSWSISGDIANVISGTISGSSTTGRLFGAAPANLREISWRLQKDQNYSNTRWTRSGTADAW